MIALRTVARRSPPPATTTANHLESARQKALFLSVLWTKKGSSSVHLSVRKLREASIHERRV
ncbi:MAG: hypothetical protein KF764_17310 [Labilithrix sp.]|nr:hypothetical protein [Labilithrix sp.]MBX3221858.1 hypothetical protein [Labilithrix sp.]